MRCQYCGYDKLSLIKVWEDKNKTTWRRYTCLSCGRKFNFTKSGEKAQKPKSRLSKYARR